MARQRKKSTRGTYSKKIPSFIFSREVIGILLLSLTVFLIVALSSSPPEKTILVQLFSSDSENLAGEAGAYLASIFYFYLGWSSIWIPLGPAVIGVLLLFRKPLFLWQRLFSLVVLVMASCILLAKGMGYLSLQGLIGARGYGGWLGRWGEPLLSEKLGELGSWIVLLPVFLLTLLGFFKISLQGFMIREKKREKSFKKIITEKSSPKETEMLPPSRSSVTRKPGLKHSLETESVTKDKEEHQETEEKIEIKSSPSGYKKSSEIELPPLSILLPPKDNQVSETPRESETLGQNLEKALVAFGVQGNVRAHHCGPVITTYEFEPQTGIKTSKLNELSQDLAREINTASLRVVGKVSGKSLIGIEVPSPQPRTVCLREVMESEMFKKQNRVLAAGIGLDTTGEAVVTDLSKMPHLLVAGTTGSGKSVALNAMICSILFSRQPTLVRMLMVDPKMLELSAYQGIPHLLAPVVTDMQQAADILLWTVAEMEERYQLMSEMRVKSLVSFNKRIAGMLEKGKKPTRRWIDPQEWISNKQDHQKRYEIPLEPQPMIVVIIDEFADLMIQAGKEVEGAVTRLGQLARAAGIHLMVATQRPSVDVVTGVIKANFPSRLAFQVASKVDSRTILDKNGAESLLGRGDGLFKAPGTSKLQRVQAPFVSEEELKKLVSYLCNQSKS